MKNILVLSLPLLVVWLAFKEEVQMPQERELEWGGSQTERVGARVRSGVESIQGSERKLQAGWKLGELKSQQTRSLLGLGGEKKSIPLERAGTDELVDEVVAEIEEELLVNLTEKELGELRDFIARSTSAEAGDQAWICWGEDVSPEKAMAFHEAEKLVGFAGSGFALFANQFLGAGKWSRTATDGISSSSQGTPTVVTWSIVPDGTSAPGLSGQSNSDSDFRSWMASIYGGSTTGPASEEGWFEIFEAAFEEMAESCGVILRYEENDDGRIMRSTNAGFLGVRGDIRIGARALDGNSNTLAFAFAPNNGDIVFDSDDSTFDNTSSNSLRLFNVIAHELGHSLGLAHVCPLTRSKLMEPLLATNFRGPRFDEFQSLQRLYGDRLEVDGSLRNNDGPEVASLVEYELDQLEIVSRLSIDDNTDVDYYEIEASARQILTVSLRPGEGTYLEGGSLDSGCSAGEDFASEAIHDLSIELFGPDQTTLLASADSEPVGEIEELADFDIPDDGSYFIRVTGDTANAAQLYQLRVRMEAAPAAVLLRAGVEELVAESGSVKNNRLDLGETIKIRMPITNVGALSSEGLFAEVEAPSGVTVFSEEISPSIGAGGEGFLEVVFGADGECGELVELDFTISDEAGEQLAFSREFELGSLRSEAMLTQQFDAASALPAGWTSEESGAGVAWLAVSSRFVSPIRSAFTPGVSQVAEASLISPEFTLQAGQNRLAFQHTYDMETGFDGGVLEVSRDGGDWFDLIEATGVTVTGGYDREIRTGFESAIAGQMAWSSQSGGFVPTTVVFPASWEGETLKLRWRAVHDNSSSEVGWWIDEVEVSSEVADCEVHRPVLSLTFEGGELNENVPEREVTVLLVSELPLLEDVAVLLTQSGSASAADFEGSLEVVLPAGATSVVVPISVSVDDLLEGEETLVVTLPDDQLEFAAGENASEAITILDRSGILEWAAGFYSGPVDVMGDTDGDGMSLLQEYLLGTDPTSRLSKIRLELVSLNEGLLLPLGVLPDRADATLGVEFSTDLLGWDDRELITTEEGIVLAQPAGKGFYRLTFTLDQ